MTQGKHGASFEIIERGPNNSWQTWLATCKCKQRWTDATYEAAEDKWRRHVHENTGIAPQPMGNRAGRWSA